jgi:3-phosphoglycerate kinase
VIFSHDTIGKIPEKIIGAHEDGDVALLQNVRFQPEKKRTIRICGRRWRSWAIFM